jgi:formiminotetrahydrofolate cyclodeaminase
MLIDLPVSALLDELASAHETPGGGSALALAVAAAAAVLGMAARVSAPDWEDAAGIAAQADALRSRAAALVDEDADAYAHALEARDAAAALPAERRDWEIGRAFAAAAEPPLAIVRIAADVGELAAVVAKGGDARVHVDAGIAAAVAAAAARGGLALVRVNLTTRADDPRLEEATALARAAEDAAARALAG